MTIEEELKQFKIDSLKMARRTAIVFAVTSVLTLIFWVYGFVTYEVNSERAEASKSEITNLKGQLVKCQSEKDFN